jgi:hypothetical protein
MSGAIPPLPQYAFMAWYSVKAQGLYIHTHAPCIGTAEYDGKRKSKLLPRKCRNSMVTLKLFSSVTDTKEKSRDLLGVIITCDCSKGLLELSIGVLNCDYILKDTIKCLWNGMERNLSIEAIKNHK